ncbi:MAG: hypothetical protein U1C18_00650, partial [Patescibacteria group bacterium]|nr:hypothetical protein [Patescibacteria group bacterium]
MEEENSKHNEILKAVSDLSERVGGLSGRVDDLSGKFDGLSEKLDRKTGEIMGLVEETLEAIGHFSDKTEERFTGLESETAGIKSDIADIKYNMVTKSYLDEKLFDLRGDVTALTRKEDAKLLRLVGILE